MQSQSSTPTTTITTTPTPPAKETKKPDNSDSDYSDEDVNLEDHEPTQEDIDKAMRQYKIKLKEAADLKQYKEQLRTTTLKTFTDKPDEVSSIRCLTATDTSILVAWDMPCLNNSPIAGFRIYLNQKAHADVPYDQSIPAEE